MLIKLRKFLIKLLAGKMGVVLNASLGVSDKGAPYIAYACRHGGMCELSSDWDDFAWVYADTTTQHDVLYFKKNGTAVVGGTTSGTVIATTSGTSWDFTGLPTGIKHITCQISGFSTNGTSEYEPTWKAIEDRVAQESEDNGQFGVGA